MNTTVLVLGYVGLALGISLLIYDCVDARDIRWLSERLRQWHEDRQVIRPIQQTHAAPTSAEVTVSTAVLIATGTALALMAYPGAVVVLTVCAFGLLAVDWSKGRS